MKIYTKAGELAYKVFAFSDSQPHFELQTFEREFNEVTIETAIKSTNDLFLVLLASQVLRNNGYAVVNLDIRYLLGARMDRAISWSQPFTLEVVANLINGGGFNRVRILDAHSEVTTRLIRNSVNILPAFAVAQANEASRNSYKERCRWVIPDKGAVPRVMELWHRVPHATSMIIRASKVRDTSTGALTGFSVDVGKGFLTSGEASCLIIDDICDGGGTFVGLAKELRKAGAKSVNLFVTHGIFSKALPLEGIDKVFTTDSFFNGDSLHEAFESEDESDWNAMMDRLVVIPICMKDL